MLLTCLTAPPLAGQISPGPLARAHGDLEGTANCVKCHRGGRSALSAQCASCHREIGWLAEQGRGVHGAPAVRSQACATCHPDHAGAGFELVKWPEGSAERFDHRRAGWPLTQRHAETACADCHAAKYQTGPARTLAAGSRGGRWTGLETGCGGCHEDIHRGALGADCAQCHDASRWTTTPGFSHDTTGYPLTDKHTTVACEKCHLTAALATRQDAAGRPVPVYRPVPHESCAACHRDPHAGRLGERCASCHTTKSFQQIDKEHFDHQRTRYPLEGRHATTGCAACHGRFATAAQKKPAFASCSSCHADAHNRTGTLAGRNEDCATCHTLNGFAPARLSLAQHARTAYPLEGKHTRVTCSACHVKATGAQAARWGTARVVLQPPSATCRSCHGDDHGSQLSARPDRGECAACHTTSGWAPSRLTPADHARLGFPLLDRHAAASCAACHGVARPGLPAMTATASLGRARFRFELAETECAACHQDPHGGRYATGGALPVAGGCAACHDVRHFRPAVIELPAHADYGFALDGAHRATPCVACHEALGSRSAPVPALVRQAGVKPLRLEAPRSCAGCHQTPHGRQFEARADQGRCESCHGAGRWQPADRFDHDRDASFRLGGGHERVPCNRCHPTEGSSAGAPQLRFRPLSGRCESCHAGKEVK